MVFNGLTEEELNLKNVIYCATFNNGKKYIGLTKSKLRKRLMGHRCDSINRNKNAFHNAINKYGIESIKWSILKICKDSQDLCEAEKYYIKKYKRYLEVYPEYNEEIRRLYGKKQ